MIDVLQKLLAFAVTLGVLITFHELGHYFVARLAGVKVLRFSIGFGRVVWSRRVGPDATEWAISAVPLGGYVKMVDEREGETAPGDRPRAFNRQSVWKRSAIVAAGPLANLLLAVLLFTGTYLAGVPGQRAVLASPPEASPAAAAGLATGDVVTAVDGSASSSIWVCRSFVTWCRASRRRSLGSRRAMPSSPSTASRCARRPTLRP